ncbi:MULTISPECIES: hypothetical protein [Burkholderia cepacia complex]|uniref:hypothetical protein n=1 Tax=Burkholderia latens TaxID=488446 RepID=UPI0011867F0F|nr:hypothetical protein [Burkholderia vietnamiensis]
MKETLREAASRDKWALHVSSPSTRGSREAKTCRSGETTKGVDKRAIQAETGRLRHASIDAETDNPAAVRIPRTAQSREPRRQQRPANRSTIRFARPIENERILE